MLTRTFINGFVRELMDCVRHETLMRNGYSLGLRPERDWKTAMAATRNTLQNLHNALDGLEAVVKSAQEEAIRDARKTCGSCNEVAVLGHRPDCPTKGA